MKEITRPHRYSAFGLEISSPFVLPALLPSDCSRRADVDIRISPIASRPSKLADVGRLVVNTSTGPIIYWRDVANFHIERGSIIHVDPLENATESAIAVPLSGIVLGALLHERGTFSLHASAVSLNEKAIAFVGEKGAGKSTITASLVAKGCHLVTDDILAFDSTVDSANETIVIPSFPQLKLSDFSSEALGFNFYDLCEISPHSEKRALRDSSLFQNNPVPLSTLYILSYSPTLTCTKVAMKNALLSILRHSYATRILGPSGNTKSNFQAMHRMVQNVQVLHLQRPRNIAHLTEVAEFVLKNELAREAGT